MAILSYKDSNGNWVELPIISNENKIEIDSLLSDTSENPVQNKVVKKAIDDVINDFSEMETEIDNIHTDVSNLNDDLTDIVSNTTTNLLNPTLQSQVIDGMTITDNWDGTYTLNGTNNSGDILRIEFNTNLKLYGGVSYNVLSSFVSESDLYVDLSNYVNRGWSIPVGLQKNIVTPTDDEAQYLFRYVVCIGNGKSVNNLVVKPMVTTNLNATISDFVSFTGTTGKLNGDVAYLKALQSNHANIITNMSIEMGMKADSFSLSKVATSGSYTDLSNKPTIPTVNNGTLTIQKNGSNVTTFSANQSGNATANITTPDGMISDAYNANTTYAVGQYCIYNNSLWRCKTQCKGQTPAENSYWTKRSIGQEIKQLNTDLSAKEFTQIGIVFGQTKLAFDVTKYKLLLCYAQASNGTRYFASGICDAGIFNYDATNYVDLNGDTKFRIAGDKNGIKLDNFFFNNVDYTSNGALYVLGIK